MLLWNKCEKRRSKRTFEGPVFWWLDPKMLENQLYAGSSYIGCVSFAPNYNEHVFHPHFLLFWPIFDHMLKCQGLTFALRCFSFCRWNISAIGFTVRICRKKPFLNKKKPLYYFKNIYFHCKVGILVSYAYRTYKIQTFRCWLYNVYNNQSAYKLLRQPSI